MPLTQSLGVVISLIQNFQFVVPILAIEGPFIIALIIGAVATIVEEIVSKLFKTLANLAIPIFVLTFGYVAAVFFFWPQIAGFFGNLFQIPVVAPDAFVIFSNLPLLLDIGITFGILYLVIMGSVFVSKKFFKEGIMQDAGSVIIGPLGEELLYRYLMLSICFALGFDLTVAIFIQAVLFGYCPNHVIQKDSEGKWTGAYRPFLAFSLGILWGFFAVKFGIVFSFVMHALGNLVGTIIVKVTHH
jgi:hypothetical protein